MSKTHTVSFGTMLLQAAAAGVGDSLLFFVIVIVPLIVIAAGNFFIFATVLILLYLTCGVPLYGFLSWQLHKRLGLQTSVLTAWFVLAINFVAGYGGSTRAPHTHLILVWVSMAIFAASIVFVVIQEVVGRYVKNGWIRAGVAVLLLAVAVAILHVIPARPNDVM